VGSRSEFPNGMKIQPKEIESGPGNGSK